MFIPENNVPVTFLGPKRLLIYSAPKVGKTSLVLQLPGYHHLDLEGSAYGFYEGKIISVNSYSDLVAFFKEAREKKFKTKFLGVDTITKLEDFAKERAKILYQNSPTGKNWNGSDITTLPNGAGYAWLRIAFEELISKLHELCDYIILIGHLKNTSLSSDSEEIIIKELALTGKNKDITMANADAIGFMYVDKENPNCRILSFVAEPGTIAGSRVTALNGQRVKISEFVDGVLKTNWNIVYPELNG